MVRRGVQDNGGQDMKIMNLEFNGYKHEVYYIPSAEIEEKIDIKHAIGGYSSYDAIIYIPSDKKYQVNLQKIVIHELGHMVLACSGHSFDSWTEEPICEIFAAFTELIWNLSNDIMLKVEGVIDEET